MTYVMEFHFKICTNFMGCPQIYLSYKDGGSKLRHDDQKGIMTYENMEIN